MSEKKEESLYWRRLDNSAKIFPISAGKKYSTVFRLSVLLKENVNKEILEKAVIQTLNNYNMFRVKMKAGFFWYYLEYNPKEPIIEEEKDYPCKYIDPKTNNGYLFKITYFENKINIDIFHALTDGNTGTTFFREIIYNYLELYYPNELKQENRQLRKIDFDTEDLVSKVANELRETIGKIPNLAIFIDEVHHVADDEIKLNKVVTEWNNSGTITEVIGFSGTPYLDSPEVFKITPNITIKNTDISNTIYYYPLTAGIDNFLKKPKIIASTDNNPLNIIKEGLTEFFNNYKDVEYNGVLSKIAIYCGNIKNLEETIYPFVSKYVTKLGMNPNEVILKYHGGNKDYTLPKENDLEFESLNTPLSKKRIILLV